MSEACALITGVAEERRQRCLATMPRVNEDVENRTRILKIDGGTLLQEHVDAFGLGQGRIHRNLERLKSKLYSV